ncbi:MAG: hypothetical protein ACK52V_10340 [Betaproteobacteria bacterium]|jgi:hypothetical protein
MAKRNPIEVTFHFNTIEEAIATLGSLIQKAAPVANLDSPAEPVVVAVPVVKQRKPRADAGKPRGPYKNVEALADADPKGHGSTQTPSGSTPEPAGTGPVTHAAETVTAPGNAEQQAATQTATPESPGKPAAPTPTDTEIQDALTRLFDAKGASVAIQLLGEFGVKRGRDLAPEQRAEFIRKADELAKQQ